MPARKTTKRRRWLNLALDLAALTAALKSKRKRILIGLALAGVGIATMLDIRSTNKLRRAIA